MAVNAHAGNYEAFGGAEQENHSGQRRARIRERFDFYRGRFSGDVQKEAEPIDLEPIEPVRVQKAQAEEDSAQRRANLHRGNIINIQI